jgi:hypothetical protein
MEYWGQQDLTEVSGMVDRPRNALKERYQRAKPLQDRTNK